MLSCIFHALRHDASGVTGGPMQQP